MRISCMSFRPARFELSLATSDALKLAENVQCTGGLPGVPRPVERDAVSWLKLVLTSPPS